MLDKFKATYGDNTKVFFQELAADFNSSLSCSNYKYTARSFYAKFKDNTKQKKWRVKQLTSRGDFHGSMCAARVRVRVRVRCASLC